MKKTTRRQSPPDQDRQVKTLGMPAKSALVVDKGKMERKAWFQKIMSELQLNLLRANSPVESRQRREARRYFRTRGIDHSDTDLKFDLVHVRYDEETKMSVGTLTWSSKKKTKPSRLN